MAPLDVVVTQTGIANTASVLAGLARAGASPMLSADPAVIRDARALVLPGVGSFAPAMARLRALGLVADLRARIRDGRPTLCICLGMQILADGSDESPGVPGLGIVPGRAVRFDDTVRVPQLGWNRITPSERARVLQPGFAYFANSYAIPRIPSGWEGATATHGRPFVAALERGPVLACQFHPELSSTYGQGILARWLECARKEVPAC